jgi:hypothetical protein
MASIFVTPGLALAASMSPGLWSMTMSAEADGRAEPLPEVTQCVSQADVDDETRTLPRPQGKCSLTNVVHAADRTTYDLACLNGPMQSRGKADIRFANDRYEGTVVMALTERGRPAHRFVMRIAAKRLGDCNK